MWGVLAVHSMHERLPPDMQARLVDFAALVASALANVQAWSELEASRVRIINAADEARRRVMRDLHDGAQQRVVVLALKARRRFEVDLKWGARGTAHDRFRAASCRPVPRRPRGSVDEAFLAWARLRAHRAMLEVLDQR
jgi:hypothetical protein